MDHYVRIIRELDSPPMVMGHSIGGTITQLLVDRGLGDDRAPLLFAAFGDDHVVPAKASRHNAETYRKSNAVTEFKEFRGRPHFPCAPGWEEVADYALDWALRNARGS